MYNKKLYFQQIKNTHIPTRRNFIRSSLQAGIVISISPAMARNLTHMQQKVRVGVITVDNAVAIQQLLSKHSDKILLAINGHSHINAALEIGGVHYVHINSASYYWVGGKYKHDSYAKDIIQDHRWIAYTCPYKDALFATLTIDPSTLTVSIEGINSTWVGKSPEELQVEALSLSSSSSLDSNAEIAPRISNRSFLR